MALIPSDIEKIERYKHVLFMDTTPTAINPTWKPVGIGITDMAISYNPQVETEQWIIEQSARSDHTGNQKQTTVTQKAYKNDPVFEFVADGRDKLNYKTKLLEVDVWDGSGTPVSYPAKQTDGLVTVTSYMGDTGQIEYDIYFEGDPVEGTVVLADGVPTFTPSASL